MTARPGTRDEFFAGVPFPPDDFQIEAAAAIEAGASVVVTAPTGAGKTLVAEYAVERALAAGHRAFYTTPIKALSNQKFGDFTAIYGDGGVGLLTGDNVINGDAPLVVMTTEVLRNMIYAEAAALDDLAVVVLDEVHYLQDPFRGSVWEEVIIHLPARVRLVCLSATIANPEEFTEWVRSRRGDTRLVLQTERPVPLESLYLVKDRHRDRQLELLPVFDTRRPRKVPNPRAVRMMRQSRGRWRRFATPRRVEVAEILYVEGLLPAIYFVFSRAGCEQAAEHVAASDLRFTTGEQRNEIRAHAEARTAHLAARDLAILGYDKWVGLLERGVAAHHAGMVPAFKETVEELFAAGLIQIVFATETLALGINMPARSVVLERLSKFTGESHELLQPGDYTQLTGRAGRRGIDTKGTAIVLHTPHVGFDKVAAIAAAGSHPLRSSFQPSYNMAVNLVASYPRERAEELLGASFAQFRVEARRAGMEAALRDARRDADEARAAAECRHGDIWAHLAASGDGEASAADVMRRFARTTVAGEVFELDSADGPQRWVLLARGVGASPRLLMLAETGELRRLRPDQLPEGIARLGTLDLPEPFRPRDSGFQRLVLDRLAEVTTDRRDGPVLEEATPPGSVAACPQLPEHREWARRARRADRDAVRIERRLAGRSEGLVVRFRAILDLLEAWGYMSGWTLTPKGERLRFVYNELDLLVAEAADGGMLSGLDGPELAGVASLFVYEPRRGDDVGGWPSEAVYERAVSILDLHARLRAAEAERGLPETRTPDPGFAWAASAWAAGATLRDLFGEDDFAAGDFVRNCRQLLDLLRQLRDAVPSITSAAGEAIKAVDRGVVAAGGML